MRLILKLKKGWPDFCNRIKAFLKSIIISSYYYYFMIRALSILSLLNF